MSERSAAEQEFIDQYTRKLMVEWCAATAATGMSPTAARIQPELDPFVQHAITKTWLAKDGSRILTNGWLTAARFLKR